MACCFHLLFQTRKDSVSYSKRTAGPDGIETSTQDGNESEPEFEILSSFQCVPAPEVDDIDLPFPGNNNIIACTMNSFCLLGCHVLKYKLEGQLRKQSALKPTFEVDTI